MKNIIFFGDKKLMDDMYQDGTLPDEVLEAFRRAELKTPEQYMSGLKRHHETCKTKAHCSWKAWNEYKNEVK
jgi:hypothetical protein